jgi:hypothetical protein
MKRLAVGLIIIGALTLIGCGGASHNSTVSGGGQTITSQPIGESQQRQCDLAAKAIERSEIARIEEGGASKELSDTKVLEAGAAERAAAAIRKCK